MNKRFILSIAALGLSLAVGGCASKDEGAKTAPAEKAAAQTAESPPPAAASETQPEAPPPAAQPTPPAPPPAAASPAPEKPRELTYYPFGKDGATVLVKPVGEAFISLVNGKIDTSDGKPIPIVEGISEGYYDRVALSPGRVSLRIGSVSATNEAEISFDAVPGNYLAQALIYTQDGKPMWTPVVTRGTAGGPIVAARGEVILGLTPIKAVQLLSAPAEDVEKVLSDVQETKTAELVQRANAHFETGRKHFSDKRFEDSVKEFSAAIDIAPGFDSAYVYRGMALFRLKKPAEAASDFDKAIEAARARRGADSEWLAWPHYEKGMALLALRKIDEAFAELDESIRLKPTPGALAARGNAYFVQGQMKNRAGDQDAARQFFLAAGADVDRGLSLSNNNVQLWSMKSGVHFMLGETPQACRAARKACELGNCGIVKDFPECKKDGP